MKLRFFIYGSLLFIALTLPVVYEAMNENLQKQEIIIRKQKENWFYFMGDTELNFASRATNAYTFWYHYIKACNYIIVWCEMMKEDIVRLSK